MYFHPVGTEKINENVFVLNSSMVNFYVYTNGRDTICFDSGINSLMARRSLDKEGIDPGSIKALFLTHSDYDHAGGLGVFKDADVYLSADEEQMINGKTARMLFLKHNHISRKDYKLMHDNDILKIGDIRVKAVATPGHTPGSMSYIVDDKTLFAGDTLLVRGGEIIPFNRPQNMDTKTQLKSIEKLKQIKGIEMICTGHSGYMRLQR